LADRAAKRAEMAAKLSLLKGATEVKDPPKKASENPSLDRPENSTVVKGPQFTPQELAEMTSQMALLKAQLKQATEQKQGLQRLINRETNWLNSAMQSKPGTTVTIKNGDGTKREISREIFIQETSKNIE